MENIIIDKVSTVPTARNRKNDTSAPMDIGMAAKDVGEHLREEVGQLIVDLPLQAVYIETGRGQLSFGKGQSWHEKKTPRWQRWERRKSWKKKPIAERQWLEKRQRNRGTWQGRNQSMLDLWFSVVSKRRQQQCVRPLMKMTVQSFEEGTRH